jgi:hypothetical protein
MENAVNDFCWIGIDDDDEDFLDEDALLAEFEKMLNGEVNEYDKMAEKEKSEKQKNCYFHTWEIVGRGPVSDIPWYNCKKCGISKEEDDKR